MVGGEPDVRVVLGLQFPQPRMVGRFEGVGDLVLGERSVAEVQRPADLERLQRRQCLPPYLVVQAEHVDRVCGVAPPDGVAGRLGERTAQVPHVHDGRGDQRRLFAPIPAVFEDDGSVRPSADDPDLVRQYVAVIAALATTSVATTSPK